MTYFRNVIWTDLKGDCWPIDMYRGGDDGDRVRVTGVVEQRFDLPVFIATEENKTRWGIPVPEGTNLEEASRRFILVSASWERL